MAGVNLRERAGGEAHSLTDYGRVSCEASEEGELEVWLMTDRMVKLARQ